MKQFYLKRFPASIQAELWEYLKSDEQKQQVAQDLRQLKKQVQRKLCEALIDYIIAGDVPLFEEGDFILCAAFCNHTGYGIDPEDTSSQRIKPFQHRNSEQITTNTYNAYDKTK